MKCNPVAWIYQNAYTDSEYLVWSRSAGGRNWRGLVLQSDLASAQAENLKLREALEGCCYYSQPRKTDPLELAGVEASYGSEKLKAVEAALATKSDYSALREVCLEVAHKVDKSHETWTVQERLNEIVDEVLRCKN